MNLTNDLSYTPYQCQLVEEKSNYLHYTREELINKLIDYLPSNSQYRSHLLSNNQFRNSQSLSKLRNVYSKLINRKLKVSKRISKRRKRRPDRNGYYGFCTEYTHEDFPPDHYLRREYVRLPFKKLHYWIDLSHMPKDKLRNIRLAFSSIRDLIQSLFMVHNRIIVVRLDFGLKERKEDLPFINACFNRLLDRLEYYHKEYLGYICTREYKEQKGIHLHCLLFLDGNKVRNEKEFVENVRRMWGKYTTKGFEKDDNVVNESCKRRVKEWINGYVYCRNYDKNKLPDEGECLGLVKYTDVLTIEKLVVLSKYLIKDISERDWLVKTGNNPKSRLFTCTSVANYPSLNTDYHDRLALNVDYNREYLVRLDWIQEIKLQNEYSLFDPKRFNRLYLERIVRLNPLYRRDRG
nr:MAG TPA: Inovirus Gp2 [Bacteriophage sp.]